MNDIEFKNFLYQQVYRQRNLFLENRNLTESQKYKKIVTILRENETLDEGLFDSLSSIVGGGKQKVKDFLARRVIAHLGVPVKHPLNTYFLTFLNDLSMKEMQGLFTGDRRMRQFFAAFATKATMDVLKNDFSDMFGLKPNTYLGGAIQDGITKAIASKDFESTLRKSYYESLGNMADEDLDSAEAGEDTDGDGVTDGDEQVLGTNPEAPDEPESIKQQVAGTGDTATDDAATTGVDDKLKDTAAAPEQDTDEGKLWVLYWVEDNKYKNYDPEWNEKGMVTLASRKEIEDKIKEFKEKSNYEADMRAAGQTPYYIVAYQKGEDGKYKRSSDIMPMEEHPDWSTKPPAEEPASEPEATGEDATTGAEEEQYLFHKMDSDIREFFNELRKKLASKDEQYNELFVDTSKLSTVGGGKPTTRIFQPSGGSESWFNQLATEPGRPLTDLRRKTVRSLIQKKEGIKNADGTWRKKPIRKTITTLGLAKPDIAKAFYEATSDNDKLEALKSFLPAEQLGEIQKALEATTGQEDDPSAAAQAEAAPPVVPDEADPVVDTTATVDADGNVEVEDEPLSDDKLNRVLKNVVLGYSKYSGDKIKALTDKRLLRNLSELADKLKSEEGYEEYPILIKRALDKESSGLAKNRAKEKLIDKGGIDKIIAKAREVLGAAQAAPEVTPEAEPEAEAPEAEPTPEPEVEVPEPTAEPEAAPEAETEAPEAEPEVEAPKPTPEPEVEAPEPTPAPDIEPTAEPDVTPAQEPEAETPEPAVDTIPPEAREQYKSLENRLNFGNLSDEEEEALSQQLEDLESKYPGVDQEPEAVATTPEATPAAAAPQAPVPASEPEVIRRPTGTKARTAAAQDAEAEAAVEDTEADAADAKADDLERAAENEPENKKLQKQATSARAEADRERVQADKAAEKAKSSSQETAEDELDLDPEADSERKKLLQVIAEVHPEGDMDLYRKNLNKFLDKQIDRFYKQGAEKAPNSKFVQDGRKTKQQYIDEYVNKEIIKFFKQTSSDIRQSGSTAGRSFIFGIAAQKQDPSKDEPSQGFRQINVELYDDKTVVLSDRSMRGKIKRPRIAEGILSELEWSAKASKGGPTRFDRIGVSAIELPAISIDDVAKANWKTTGSSLKALLLDRIKILLMNSPDETKELFDIENLVIMPADSQSGQQISGIIDNRKSKEVTVDSDYTSPRGISGRKLNDYLQGIIKNTVVEGKIKEDKLLAFSKKLAKSAIRRKAFIDLIEYFKDKGQYEGGVPEEEDFPFDDRGAMTAEYIRALLTGLGLATARRQETEDDIKDLEADVERQMQASLKSRAKKEVNEEVSVEEVFSISEEQLRRLLS